MKIIQLRKTFLILLIIGFFTYSNALFNGFVWDDEEQVVNNALVHSITNLPQFFAGSTFNTGGSGGLGGLYYKPLMTAFFSLLYSIFGPNAFFFHLFQVIIHIFNAFFVYLILKKFLDFRLFTPNILQKIPLAYAFNNLSLLPFLLSLIFLVHPINTESVVYIAALQDTQFFFFGSLAFLILLYKEYTYKNLSLVSLFLLLSLFSKETGIIFVFISFLYVFIFNKEQFKTFVSWPIFSLFIYFFMRFLIAGVFLEKHDLSLITRTNLFERIPSMPKIFWQYIHTFLYPLNLVSSQQWIVKDINLKEFFIPLIFSILTFFSIFLIPIRFIKDKETFKIAIFFILWFLIAMGLHIQIFPLDMTYADRWFYLPMVGLLGLTGLLISQIKNQKMLTIVLIAFVFIIPLLAVRTIIRNGNWKDGLTLYAQDIKFAPESFNLQNNYGVELYRKGNIKEAKIHFQKSIDLAPFWWTNWSNLGVMYEVEGDATKAAELYQKAIDKGDYYLAHENRAKVMLYTFGAKEGKKAAEESLKKLPNNSNLWLSLAIAEYQLGNKDEALLAARYSFMLSPNEQNYYVISILEQGLEIEFNE